MIRTFKTNQQMEQFLKDGNPSGYLNIAQDTDNIVFSTNNISGELLKYRGKITDIDYFGVPDDEIWYKTSDNSILNLTDSTFGDATVVSNTFDGEKGIIKFNKAVTEIGADAISYKSKITDLYLPLTITTINNTGLRFLGNINCYLYLPNSLKTIGTSAFQNLGNTAYTNADKLIVDLSHTQIEELPASCFANGGAIRKIMFPSTLQSINATALGWCAIITDFVQIFDFSKCKQIPTITSVTTNNNPLDLKSTSFKIIVPESLYDEWKETQYWSVYKKFIVKA